MNTFEISMIILIPAMTLILNRWRKVLAGQSRAVYPAYLAVCVAMSAGPLIVVKEMVPNHTALSVVLAGISLFWFALVAARSRDT